MMRVDNNRLEAVTFDGRRIGSVILTGDGILFEYDPQWMIAPGSFPVSPAIPFSCASESTSRRIAATHRFFENLLPEGDALDVVARTGNLSKRNLFGLLRLIGKESSGAVLLQLPEVELSRQSGLRLISTNELSQRLRNRERIPFSVWDGKVRLSIAGYQDKIAVFMLGDEMFLAEHPMASTHILKPVPRNPDVASLVANEHYCMALAGKSGLRVATTKILRVPEPVLIVTRFDRACVAQHVERSHVIDMCQALDLSASYKYEKNFGNGKDVAHIRDGVSFSKIASLAPLTKSPAQFKQELLRWALFQYLIGNADAHGKNLSLHVLPGGVLAMAPAYDLVCTALYNGLEDEMAMGVGDEFKIVNIGAYQWALFASECGIPQQVLAREMVRLAKTVKKVAPELAKSPVFAVDERVAIADICSFLIKQSDRLFEDAKLVTSVKLDNCNGSHSAVVRSNWRV